MKFALITGGTKGIGKSIAIKLLDEGYSVILNYNNDDKAAHQLFLEFSSSYQNRIFLLKQNLSLISNLGSFCENVTKISPVIDVLIFNAGKTDRSTFKNITLEDWNSVLNTNLTIPFFIIQKLFNSLSENSSIIFIGSLMSIFPHSVSISYAVSKAALNSLVKNLVKVLNEKSIRVNAILPGFVDTDWQKEKPEDIKINIIKKIAQKRFGKPEEVAHACYFLISNNYVNGELLVIDGGYSFQ